MLLKLTISKYQAGKRPVILLRNEPIAYKLVTQILGYLISFYDQLDWQ